MFMEQGEMASTETSLLWLRGLALVGPTSDKLCVFH